MFKRMMILGTVASALALAGCQDRDRNAESVNQEQPATGGAGGEIQGGGTGSGMQGGSGTSGDVGGSGSTGMGSELGGDTGSGTGVSGDTGGSGTVDDQGTGGSVAPDGMDGKDDASLLREHGRRGNISGNTQGGDQGTGTETR